MGSMTVHRAQIGIKANKKIEQRLSPSLQTISRLTMVRNDCEKLSEHEISVWFTRNNRDFKQRER